MGNVERYPWGFLRTVSREEAAATGAVAVAGGPGTATAFIAALNEAFSANGLSAPGIGGRSIRAHRGSTFTLDESHAVRFLLHRVGRASDAVIAVDASLARAVVGELLGSKVEVIDEWSFGALAYLVAHAVGEVAARLPQLAGWEVVLRREPASLIAERLAGPAPVVELAVDVAFGGAQGTIQLLAGSEVVRAARAEDIAVDGFAAAVRVDPRVSVARVTLREDEFVGLVPGDALITEARSLDFRMDAISARLLLSSSHHVAGRVGGVDGRWMITVAEGSLLQETRMDEARTDETTQLLRVSEIGVEVVVGRAKLSVEGLARLTPGQVVELDRNVGDPVELHANGRCVARGELVDVQGRVGVRVTSLADGR